MSTMLTISRLFGRKLGLLHQHASRKHETNLPWQLKGSRIRCVVKYSTKSSQPDPLTQVKVIRRDKGLILLEGKDFEAQSLRPGHLLLNEASRLPQAVILFNSYGYHFAIDFVQAGLSRGEPLSCGQSLLAFTDTVLRIQNFSKTNETEFAVSNILSVEADANESSSEVFQMQPRDLDRQMISESWSSANAAVDMLTPIGKGQSMFIVDGERERNIPFIYDLVMGIYSNIGKDELNGVFVVKDNCERSYIHRLGMLKDSIMVYPDEHCEDTEANQVLASFVGCTLAESYRDDGMDSLLVLPNLDAFHNVWKRGQRLAAAQVIESRNSLPEALFAPGADRTEIRQFYSSLIQRAAKLNDSLGHGSMTMLHALGNREFSIESAIGQPEKDEILNKVYSFEDFDSSKFSERDIDRIKLLVDRGISLTSENLRKVGIKEPRKKKEAAPDSMILTVAEKLEKWNLLGDIETKASLRQHAEELKSLSDGHLCIQPPAELSVQRSNSQAFTGFAINPKTSLTRIGIGTNVNDVRDTRPPALRNAIGGLRLSLIELMDIDPVRGEMTNRAKAWRNFFYYEENGFSTLEVQVCVGYAVSAGLFDDPRNLLLLENGINSKFSCSIKESISDELKSKILTGTVQNKEIDEFVRPLVPKLSSP